MEEIGFVRYYGGRSILQYKEYIKIKEIFNKIDLFQ